MKKPIFNLGLYLEALRQTKLVSILSVILVSLVSGFTIVITWMSALEAKMDALEYGNTFTKWTIDGIQACAALIAIGFVAAPILTVTLYQFQNKRNTSDFYHSIPHTRVCLFLSNQAAILTHIVACTVVCVLFSIVLSAMASSVLVLILEPLIYYAICTLVVGFLVSAAVAMAMAITGTGFTNLILSGMILFLPRIILVLVGSVLGEIMPNEVAGHFLPFTNASLNLVTGLSMGFFGIGDMGIDAMLANLPSIFYTLGLGIAYTALACFFFHRRKSEAAGFAAPSGLLQTVYRVIIGSFVTFISTIALYMCIMNKDGIDMEVHVIIWTLGVVAYYLYELLTTKKWKNLAKATPGLAIVLAVNLLGVGACHVVFNYELNFTPDPEEIKSISIASRNEEETYYDFASYAQSRADEVKITDPELIKLIAESLKENVDTYHNRGINGFHDEYIYGSNNPETIYTAQYFRIQTAFETNYRRVWFPAEHSAKLTEVLEADEEYRKIWTTLPNMIEGTGYVSSNHFWNLNTNKLDVRDYQEIFAMLREEIRSCDFSDWYVSLGGSQTNLFNLQYAFLDGLATKRIEIPIYTDIAPKTVKMIMEKLESGREPFETMLNEIRSDWEAGTKTDYSINAQVGMYGLYGGYYDVYSVSLADINDEKIDLLLANAGKASEITATSNLMSLTLTRYSEEYDTGRYFYEEYSLLLPLNMDNETIKSELLDDVDFGYTDPVKPLPGSGEVVVTKPIA